MKKILYLIAIFLLAPLAVPAQAEHHQSRNVGTAASAHPDATKAGFEMLQAGGSATDAAMAMMLALTVVEPQSSGIGGGGFFLHHDAKQGWMQTIDGREMAPAAANSNRFLGEDGKPLPFMQAMPTPWVEPADISHAVVYLSSDESRFVTGQQLRVDAGAGMKIGL